MKRSLSQSKSPPGVRKSKPSYDQILEQIHIQGFAPRDSCKAIITYADRPDDTAKTTFSPQGKYLNETQLQNQRYWACTPTSPEDQAQLLSQAFENLASRELVGPNAYKIRFFQDEFPVLKFSKKSDEGDRRVTFNILDAEGVNTILYSARFEGIPGRRFHLSGITRTTGVPGRYDPLPDFSLIPPRAVTEEEKKFVLSSIYKNVDHNFTHEGTLSMETLGVFKKYKKASISFQKIPRGLSLVDKASSSVDRQLRDSEEQAKIAQRMERRKLLRAKKTAGPP